VRIIRKFLAPTLLSRLRLIFSLTGLITLALCLGTVGYLTLVSRQVSSLAGEVSGHAAPAAELMRLTNTVALKVSQYTRTRAEPERLAALQEFSLVRRRIGELRVELAARSDTAEVGIVIRDTQQRLAEWKAPPAAYTRGYGKLYLDHVTQANEGCDFDFLRADK